MMGMDNKQMSRKLKEILALRHEPVAVKLIHRGETIPDGDIPEKRLRHCQSIMQARKGECFVMPANKHACAVGGSSLGLLDTPAKVSNGEFHCNLGMFGSPEAAAKMIEERIELKAGSVIATVVQPLETASFEPDVVILVDLPETLYWLIPAATFGTGGRINISTAPFQATCVDATLIPVVSGRMNMSLGCFGCRRATDIGNDEMIAGIPGKDLPELIENLEEIREGPMKKARGS